MEYRRRLLFHGIALFLIGLLTGLAEQHFANVRMGLAAHLEGVRGVGEGAETIRTIAAPLDFRNHITAR